MKLHYSAIGTRVGCAVSMIFSTVAVGDEGAVLPPHRPDIVVAIDGTGDFTTIQAAIDSVPADNTQRMVIFIKAGVYREKVRLDRSFLTLRGQGRERTRIEFPIAFPEYRDHPDRIGRAVLNLPAGTDHVLEDLSVVNTQVVNQRLHAFAIHGAPTRTILQRCNIESNGWDTLALWNRRAGLYYHADCSFRGSDDVVCPRGWCYITRSRFEFNITGGAMLWHDGDLQPDMKLVVRDSTFVGNATDLRLGRYAYQSQFYLINLRFPPMLTGDIIADHSVPPAGQIGSMTRRGYFANCRRTGSDLPWHNDNLDTAPGRPTAEDITAAWAFGGHWDPESTTPPQVVAVKINDRQINMIFDEPVTVKRSPTVQLRSSGRAKYVTGSGSKTLTFGPIASDDEPTALDFAAGSIIASHATVTFRAVAPKLPTGN